MNIVHGYVEPVEPSGNSFAGSPLLFYQGPEFIGVRVKQFSAPAYVALPAKGAEYNISLTIGTADRAYEQTWRLGSDGGYYRFEGKLARYREQRRLKRLFPDL